MRETVVSYYISQIFVALMDLMLSSLTSSECFLLMDNTDQQSYHQIVRMVLGTVLVKKKTAVLLKIARATVNTGSGNHHFQQGVCLQLPCLSLEDNLAAQL